MLDQKTIDVVKATLPAVAQLGPKLTAAFYEKMLGNYPELKNIFNMTHQQTGSQREALFNAIAAYASNIENPGVLKDAITKIAHKHCSLGVTPEQYDIVGKCLLETIDDLLHPGDEVLQAWGNAYMFLKDVFISVEKEIYESQGNAKGGWFGKREFKVVSKNHVSSNMVEFELKPADGKEIAAFRSGQYIALYIKDPSFEYQQIRQYSIACASNNQSYKICVKEDGVVSKFLHQSLAVNDSVQIAPPFGDFFLDEDSIKDEVVLLSAGSGITPMMSMLENLSDKQSKLSVRFIYSTQSKDKFAYADKIKELGSKLGCFKEDIFLTQENDEAFRSGRVNLSELDDFSPDAQFYLCGPVGFMQNMAAQLLAKNVDKQNIHYECFGPHKVI